MIPDQCSSHHYSLLKEGSLDIECTFSTDIKESTSILFYMEFNNIIEREKKETIFLTLKFKMYEPTIIEVLTRDKIGTESFLGVFAREMKYQKILIIQQVL